jgi:hypothetical protein
VDHVPEGYEIYEAPEEAQVMIRKIRVSRVRPEERAVVAEAIRRDTALKNFIIDLENDCMVVYVPNRDPDECERLLSLLGGPAAAGDASMQSWFIKTSRYIKMLRFTLASEEPRRFTVDRWCFRGRIDGWLPVGSPGALEVQVERTVKHLGRESFFELF